MALLMGKILGMMTYISVVLCVGLVSSKISDFVMENVMHVNMEATASSGIDLSIFTGMGTGSLILCILTMVIGFLSFSILSGLFGSACTKMEDIQIAGRVELPIVIISYVIQIALLILLVLLSAKTYRNLLLSDSSTPKLKAIFKSAKA